MWRPRSWLLLERINLIAFWLRADLLRVSYCKYYSPGIVVFLVSNRHVGSSILMNRSWKTEVNIGATRSNPCPHFSICKWNDVISVHRCLTSFQKNNCILLLCRHYIYLQHFKFCNIYQSYIPYGIFKDLNFLTFLNIFYALLSGLFEGPIQ